LLYTFNKAKAAERHKTPYFELFGNRAIYNDGWFAGTIRRAPWQTGAQKPLQSFCQLQLCGIPGRHRTFSPVTPRTG
jgi:hypothetical protein